MPRKQDQPRPLRAPGGYRPLSAIERRTVTPEMITHNRRLGWMLTLAREHGVVPASDLPVEELIEIVRDRLPADFPAELTDDEVATYVSKDEDRELALSLL